MPGQANGHAPDHDVIIVGGGLSGSLIAWRLQQLRPELSTLVLERGATLGGNHTWSFHATDLPAGTLAWIEPLIVHRWDSQEVRFPRYRRPLATGYFSASSERLHAHLAPIFGERMRCGTEIASVGADGVTLQDGSRITAGAVIDARGQGGFEHLLLGYQKFVGRVFEFEEPHGLEAPIIMDATVPQIDGYRFVYVLPFTATSALVEDTYFADGADYSTDEVVERLKAYCHEQGWRIADVLHTEEGVLPMAVGGDIEAHLDAGIPGVAPAGLRAGLFHPLTGYSLPDAAALAEAIAAQTDFSGPALSGFARQHAIRTWNNRGFYRMLSRFLFDAAHPDQRYIVMQRFYRLNRGLIERFYAARCQPRDKLRVLAGKPPVNVFRAISCLNEQQWSERQRSAA